MPIIMIAMRPRYGVISRSCVTLIMWTVGTYRALLHDQDLSAASSFQIGV